MTTPRSLSSVVVSIISSPILYIALLLRPICRCLHLDLLNFNCQFDAVEMKDRKWILQSFQYEEKTISRHYTQTRNIEKGGE